MGWPDGRSRWPDGTGRWPATLPRTVAIAVATAAGVAAARVLAGVLVGNPVHPVTYLGILGGVLGALVTVPAFRSLGEGRLPTVTVLARGPGGIPETRARSAGLAAHLGAGAALGGSYPHLYRTLGVGDRLAIAAGSPGEAVGVGAARVLGDPGVGGGVFAALPASLLTGLLYTLVPFLATAATWLALSTRPLTARRLATLYLAWVGYGLVLGAMVGLMKPVVGPALAG